MPETLRKPEPDAGTAVEFPRAVAGE